ncbi:MAG TPA: PKD domain-containing protein [Acidimicrobiia bacterium]|nr:PKD domain-containing protein [Acidimicrobiia bacterium]
MDTIRYRKPATQRHSHLRVLALLLALITFSGVLAKAAVAAEITPNAVTQPDPEPGDGPPEEDPPPPPVPITFDWSMPDRFGMDANGDGLVDYFTGSDYCPTDQADECAHLPKTSPYDISPSSWHVDLTACDSSLGQVAGATFTWQLVGGTGTLTSNGPGCADEDLTVPAEGVYKVKLTVSSSLGTDTMTKDVVVQDWLIVSMGDSYGSGEGNADVEQDWGAHWPPVLEAKWEDRRCHRSANAGSARAAKWLEAADPHTSVTFIHIACSGAEALKGLLETYKGQSDSREAALMTPEITPQITQARELVGNREVDAVYLSIGGNDAKFGNIVTACVVLAPCNPVSLGLPDIPIPDLTVSETCGLFVFVPPPFGEILIGLCIAAVAALFVSQAGGTAEHHFHDGLIGTDPENDPNSVPTYRLSQLYDRVNNALFATAPDPVHNDPYMGLPESSRNRVFISEYVDATKDDDGSYCPKGNLLEPLNDIRVPGLDRAEYQWIDTQVEQKLNQVISTDATAHGWNFVGGIHDAFARHGICADDTYMRGLLGESFLIQGDKQAAVHPNLKGHGVYRNRILSKLLPTLYPDAGGANDAGIVSFNNVKDWIKYRSPRLPAMTPVADAGGPYTVAEGSTKTLTNNSYDDGALTYNWSSNKANVATVSPATAKTPSVRGVDDGSATLTLGVSDNADPAPESTATAAVTVTNVAPTVAGPTTPITVNEGSALSKTATYTDPGTLDTHTAKVDYGDGSALATPSASGGTVGLSHTFADDEPGAADDQYTVKVDVTDDDNGTGTTSFPVSVANVAPTVTPVVAPVAPVAKGTSITASSSYSDPGADDATVTWAWGDGATTTQNKGVDADGPISATHSYAAAGLFPVSVTVDDHDGGVTTQSFQSVVVFDPGAGFVTGGGSINSPIGALLANPAATGPATFAFVAKYVKGSSTPTGNTQFRFQAGNFLLDATAFDWLTVSGARAQYKGTATVNGQTGFGFLITVVDGNLQPGGGPDRLRVKVWRKSDSVIVYDNQRGADDAAALTTAITGGAISISK